TEERLERATVDKVAQSLKPGQYMRAQDEEEVLLQARKSLGFLQQQSEYCSPACCIQANWRGHRDRKMAKHMKYWQLRAVKKMQQSARMLLWRRKMTAYVKEWLTEVDELDLLLDTREMLRRRALKLIE
ncbi:unnamed protein product, partial [Polarella glacialis]